MLSEQQRDFYAENGYVLASGIFSADEVAEMRQEIDATVDRVRRSGRRVEALWGGAWREKLLPADEGPEKHSVLSIHNMQYHSATFARVLVHDRFTEVVADVIGPNVQLHHVKMHLKPPEVGAPFPMHQDYHYFPHEGHSMIAAVIHVDDATVENGCLCVYPGSHKWGPVECVHEGSHHLPPDQYPLEKATPCPARAGDVLLFTYLTIHGSYVNHTESTRRIVLFQFRSPTDRPLKETHVSPGQGMMVRGVNPLP